MQIVETIGENFILHVHWKEDDKQARINKVEMQIETVSLNNINDRVYSVKSLCLVANKKTVGRQLAPIFVWFYCKIIVYIC